MGTYTADDFRTGTACGGRRRITTVVDWAIQRARRELSSRPGKWDKKAAARTVID